MDLGLHDRVYLVTGGAGGLGLASARALVAEGARVVLSGRTAASLEAAAAELGDAALTVVADNADAETPARLIAAAFERWGRLDGALVSVGGPPAGLPSAMSDEQWAGAFESVFLGTVRLCRAVAEELDEGGALALVLSTSVRNPIHVTDCALAGADIATVPYKVIEQMLHHPLTDAGLAGFAADWAAVYGEGRGVLDVLDA